MATARKDLGGAIVAPSSQSLAFGGGPPESNATEEFSNFSEPSSFQNDGQVFYNNTEFKFKVASSTIAPSWASGGNYPANIQRQAGFGTQTATVNASGYEGTAYTTNTKEYDGTAWTAANASPAALESPGGGGVLTAGFICGGESPAPAKVTTTAEYDGTNWTAGGALSTGRSSFMVAGTLTAGIAAGGSPGSSPFFSTSTEEYDGSSWTGGGALPTAIRSNRGLGTQTAGLNLAGEAAPGKRNATDHYDGSSWTSGGTLAAPASNMDGEGAQTAALATGGSPTTTTCQLYDGTSFSPTASMANARTLHATTGGNYLSALAVGGAPPAGATNATEEFNGPGVLQLEDIDVT